MTPLIHRDLQLAHRQRSEWLMPVAFFCLTTSLFPLGIGADAALLRKIAPGVVWVCALLASMLTLPQLHAGDHADGSLEQYVVAGRSLVAFSLSRAFTHWLVHGAPLVVLAPVMGLMFDLPQRSVLALSASLLLGTPVFSLLGGIGSALTLGLRHAQVLVVLLILPLLTPVLIFGSGVVTASMSGLPQEGHYSLLGAALLASLVGAPWATAAALKISLD